MPLGQFHLGGGLWQLVADGPDEDDDQDLVGLAGMVGTLTCNIPITKAVSIDGGLLVIPQRTIVVQADGTFKERLQSGELASGTGIDLLADDPALELEDDGHVQWTISFSSLLVGSQMVRLQSWTFDAPAPGWEGTIDELAPTLQVGAAQIIKGDSAYQVAVTNGFVGTQAEWLASLRGAGLELAGTVDEYGDLPGSPSEGDAYIVLADGKLYFFDGVDWPDDGDGVPFVGPVGASGGVGATGATGATGPAASWSVITDRPGPLVALGGRVTVDQLLDRGEPIIVPHRGAGANLAPESTMTAWRVGAALGLGIVDGGDWRTTKDNTLVCCHSATTDYSTRVRTPSDMSAMEAAQMVIAASTWFGGGHADSVAATAEEVFGTFGGSVVLCPEAKDAGSVPLLVDLVQRMGLQESVLPNAFDSAYLVPFVDAGCPHVQRALTAMPGEAARAADHDNGINWYSVPWNGSVTVANVETLLAEDFHVMLYTLQRACQLTQVHDWASIKSDLHYYSDDPLYFRHGLDAAAASAYRRTTDPFGTQTWYHGHIATPTDGSFAPIFRGEFRGVKRWGMLPDTVGRYVLAGWASPLTSPTTWTVDFNLTFDAMGSDSNRWAGIVACATNDQGWADSANAWHNGYLCYFRRSGQLNVAKHTAGSSGSASSSSTQSVRDPLITTSTLAAGVAITSIPCTAIASSIQAGLKFRLPNDQIATVATGGASAGATSVPVDSITPTTAVPSGSSLPQTVPLRIAVTSTTITFSRHDSVGGTVTVTDNTHRGGYLYLGQNSASAGMSTSFSEMSIT